jgi:hypothetical protein
MCQQVVQLERSQLLSALALAAVPPRVGARIIPRCGVHCNLPGRCATYLGSFLNSSDQTPSRLLLRLWPDSMRRVRAPRLT